MIQFIEQAVDPLEDFNKAMRHLRELAIASRDQVELLKTEESSVLYVMLMDLTAGPEKQHCLPWVREAASLVERTAEFMVRADYFQEKTLVYRTLQRAVKGEADQLATAAIFGAMLVVTKKRQKEFLLQASLIQGIS